ncbi:hypothetical protein GY45DRAFT_490814 [Cubamyces sp. BRFM 1775]|nr:hypothetical protein GY45DRAFT_490814 [Cubamyces sp. BRFM 1775]
MTSKIRRTREGGTQPLACSPDGFYCHRTGQVDICCVPLWVKGPQSGTARTSMQRRASAVRGEWNSATSGMFCSNAQPCMRSAAHVVAIPPTRVRRSLHPDGPVGAGPRYRLSRRGADIFPSGGNGSKRRHTRQLAVRCYRSNAYGGPYAGPQRARDQALICRLLSPSVLCTRDALVQCV